MFRRGAAGVEVFLVHPGGPLYARKDAGVWTLPKGELEPGEEALDVARREFEEETGRTAAECARDSEPAFPLGSIVQRGGKTVHAFAFAGDWPAGLDVRSNEFEMEWPPRSGRRLRFPEVDRGAFFDLERAREKLNPAQVELLDRLLAILAERERG
jgi:predicted NUDIX family NTP pyrophosphohydrolase